MARPMNLGLKPATRVSAQTTGSLFGQPFTSAVPRLLLLGSIQSYPRHRLVAVSPPSLAMIDDGDRRGVDLMASGSTPVWSNVNSLRAVALSSSSVASSFSVAIIIMSPPPPPSCHHHRLRHVITTTITATIASTSSVHVTVTSKASSSPIESLASKASHRKPRPRQSLILAITRRITSCSHRRIESLVLAITRGHKPAHILRARVRGARARARARVRAGAGGCVHAFVLGLGKVPTRSRTPKT